MGLGYVTGPTGGLAYHSAAYRYRELLWRPFVATVDAWLREKWAPRSRKLVVFGSSAGWTLNEGFLARFDEVACVEPDPIARFLFRRRFRGLKRLSQTGRDDLLTADLGEFLDERHAGAAILFSNVLGQLPLLKRAPPDREKFAEALREREWASYHDLFSARAPLKRDFPRELSRRPEDSVAAKFFAPPAEVIDHGTLWLSKDRATACAPWEIRPGRNHVIGFVHG